MSTEDVYYNHRKEPLVIVTEWAEDPLGGPAITKTYMVPYGMGIDLTVIGLHRTKPTEPADE